jgi:P-type conjugative transfer protein TrbJ
MTKAKFTILILALVVSCAFASRARAGVPVTCTNCSTVVQQILDSVTMANELATAINQYEQLIIQTEQQIFMAQAEVKRLMSLPATLAAKVDQYADHFTDLGQRLTEVNMYRGDMSALVDVYREAYPDFNVIYGLANGEDPNAIQKEWRQRSIQTDKVAEAAFKLSASQLDLLAKNQEALRSHVQRLLSVQNETEIQQASNALSSMMLTEMQDLKSLAAMQLQHDADRNLNRQKQEQMDRALWEKAAEPKFNTDFEYKGTKRF